MESFVSFEENDFTSERFDSPSFDSNDPRPRHKSNAKTSISHRVCIRIHPSQKYVSHNEHAKDGVHSYDPSHKP